MIPIATVRAQIQTLKAAGLNVEWREFPKAHTIHGEKEMSVIREFVRAGYAGCGQITGALVKPRSTRIWEVQIFTSRFAPGIQICSGRG